MSRPASTPFDLRLPDRIGRPTPVRTLQALLLLLGMLLPLNVPFSIPAVGGEKMLGWSSRPVAPNRHVVTHTMRHASMEGLLPGDTIVRINGAAVDAAQLERTRRESRPGEELRLLVRRDGQHRTIRVPVGENSASYSGYFWYRVVVALIGWLVGMALLVWRGGRPAAIALGAALLLLAPITLPSGVPAENGLLRGARVGWQLQAAAHRFFFPILLLHFLVLHQRKGAWLRSPALWTGIYAGLFVALGIVTDFLREPMLWSQVGVERRFRTVLGFAAETATIAAAALLPVRLAGSRLRLRWIRFAIVMVVGTAWLLSLTLILLGERRGLEFIWRTNGLTLLLLPPAAALYLVLYRGTGESEWHDQRRVASSASLLLTGLYGFAVAGAAAVVLSSAGRDLGGFEWLLFVTIFLATIIFSPVLRWAREMVDRRLFAHWKELESLVRAFVDRIGAELEPGRIGRRVAEEVPRLFDVVSAELVLTRELAERWDWDEAEGLRLDAHDRLAAAVAAGAVGRGGDLVPISRPDGELLGAIRLGRRDSERSYDPAERALLPAAAQGVAGAVRNAETYSRLRRAQQELADAERIASMGALAAGLAHEIKNPLAGLKMGFYVLQHEDTGSASDESFANIRRDVQRIDDLVSGLLRFTRDGGRESTEPVELLEVARTCAEDIRPRADDRSTRVVERYPDERVFTLGSREQIRLIISNLLSNALDAVCGDDLIEVAVSASDAEAEITVRDTGPGIPADRRARVFELNVSDKPGGTGFGLALARREVERLGGCIELESADGEGTLLRVTLPRLNL